MKKVDFREYAADILKALPTGVLMTTKAEGKVNSMVIGWGNIGTTWGKPSFVAYVRESRLTRKMLEKNPEFTVNIPLGDFDKKIIAVCGTESGRDVDKIEKCGLSLTEPQEIGVPGIKELPLTLECRVLYRQLQDAAAIPQDIMDVFYPKTEGNPDISGEVDAHYMLVAEILSAYIA
ncbi:MAG: flavin reductase family protein [Mogibacterium sp.]|nr:flavin reductase family protein [Mogibacterium sp.]